MDKKIICDLCGKETIEMNNPAPFKVNNCCDVCNHTKVIPLRLFIMKKDKEAFYFKTDGAVGFVVPDGESGITYKALANTMGSYIERYPFVWQDCFIYAKGSDHMKGLPHNDLFYKYTGIKTFGDVILVPTSEEGWDQRPHVPWR